MKWWLSLCFMLSLPPFAWAGEATMPSAEMLRHVQEFLVANPRHIDKGELEGVDVRPYDDIEAFKQNNHLVRQASRIIVFLTLDMPDKSLIQWLEQAKRAGAVAVIRGFYGGKLSTTIKRLQSLPRELSAGLAIAPTMFERLQIDHAPVVLVLANEMPPCMSPQCDEDPVPEHNRVSGNIGLEAALTHIAHNGGEMIRRDTEQALMRLRQSPISSGEVE